MQKCNVYVGLLSILVGGVIFYLSRDMLMFDEYGIPGERFWPYGLAWLFIGLGICQWLEIFLKRGTVKNEPVDLSSLAVKRSYLVALIAIVFGIVLNYAGFMVASLLFVPFIMWMMGEHRLGYLLVTSILATMTIYVMFTHVFSSPLPISVFFE